MGRRHGTLDHRSLLGISHNSRLEQENILLYPDLTTDSGVKVSVFLLIHSLLLASWISEFSIGVAGALARRINSPEAGSVKGAT